MTAAMEKEREAFEQWAREHLSCDLSRSGQRGYRYDPAFFGWEAWQAARSLAESPQVPVEALRCAIDMMENMATATVTARDSLKQPSADALTAFNREIFQSMANDLRTLLPKEKACSSQS